MTAPAAAPSIPGRSWSWRLGAVLKRWWLAWRLENLAILQLQAMSDRQLKDIGIPRSQIEFAVRGDLERDRAFNRYY